MKILPYGTGPTARPTRKESAREKLRVLFVGALTQAKGLGYLLTAATRLDSEISLTLIGRRVSPTVPAPALLEPHRWIPSLPHPQLLREIGQHDVLVLPSLHEGFGLVIAEALSQGTTVITTRNTVGPDLIEDGVEGFLVPIRSADAIEEKLLVLARDRPLLAAMQAAAEKKAVTMGWEKYRQRLAQLAREVVARSPV